MWSPHGLGMGGEDESADGAGRWGRFQAMWGGGGKFGLSMEGWKGAVGLWSAPLCKRARPFARRARPFGGGRALVACLVGRGSSPSRRFGDFLLFFHAAKS
jgi:hypothetical protein